jgi:hypothetical protein
LFVSRRCNSYLSTYVAELCFTYIYFVTKAICIIDLNVRLFPFYVYKNVAITLLITEFSDKIFVFNFITLGLITMFYQLWTNMECNFKN